MKTIALFVITVLATFVCAAIPPTGSITTITPTGTTQQGQSIRIYFNTTVAPRHQADNPGNYFISYYQVELSDATGNFGATPTVITPNTTVQQRNSTTRPVTNTTILGVTVVETTGLTNAGTFSVNATLPSNLSTASFSCYKVRVVCRQEYLHWNGGYGPTTPAAAQSIYTPTASGCFRVSAVANCTCQNSQWNILPTLSRGNLVHTIGTISNLLLQYAGNYTFKGSYRCTSASCVRYKLYITKMGGGCSA